MLTYAAHLPHSPLLLPQIGKSKTLLFKKTRRAVAEVAGDLYARKINTLVLITPHGPGLAESFVINLAPIFKADLGPLGNFSITASYNGAAALAYRLAEQLQARYPIKAVTQDRLDTASSAVMLQLTRGKTNYSILPLTYGLFSPVLLYDFGRDLREVLETNHKRVAIISLGDLARTQTKSQSAGADWDKALINHLHAKNTPLILESSLTEVDALAVAGWRPLVMVLGALSEINYQADVLSYQQRFGVGMMAARFIF